MGNKAQKNNTVGAVILAAGMGTRMRSSRHKVLHEIGGLSMLGHVLSSLDTLSVAKRVVVVGAERGQVESAVDNVSFAVQDKQLGTGHAVQCARQALDGFDGDVLILYGDVPMVSAATMQKLIATRQENNHALVVLGFKADDPASYGRLVLGQDDNLDAIVEFKDASPSQKEINLCNSGIMVVGGEHLFPLLDKVSNNNAAGEYYLTDLVALARAEDNSVGVVTVAEDEVRGVNSRAELAEVEEIFQNNMRRNAMENGVTLLDPKSVYFSHDTKISPDVTVGQNVVFGKNVQVEVGAVIHAFSHIEGAKIGAGSKIGPYARLRPGANVGSNVKIGNFVEVKKSDIEDGAKISHLSYIGDASVGAGANIGAGTITCNYDGFSKYKTYIG
ncbi:MAG: bifunctional UDP-N-acetylglucosamine diphosphorylase/glucosamine-1-phosphate N-acetyltransferase GlmU, partial [Sphingomonadales bacterium]|nr:bifunctional UDP-N-acetylglucosamine diphosphorylase/glucosamine-1-phosphate N-acetyltransferase GlmU [Sphingomonadales bacterium]